MAGRHAQAYVVRLGGFRRTLKAYGDVHTQRSVLDVHLPRVLGL